MTTTTSEPVYRGGARQTPGAVAVPSATDPGPGWASDGAGPGSPPASGPAPCDPLALLGDLLAGAVTAELRDLRGQIAALATEFEACGDSLIFAHRPADALRELLDETSGRRGVPSRAGRASGVRGA